MVSTHHSPLKAISASLPKCCTLAAALLALIAATQFAAAAGVPLGGYNYAKPAYVPTQLDGRTAPHYQHATTLHQQHTTRKSAHYTLSKPKAVPEPALVTVTRSPLHISVANLPLEAPKQGLFTPAYNNAGNFQLEGPGTALFSNSPNPIRLIASGSTAVAVSVPPAVPHTQKEHHHSTVTIPPAVPYTQKEHHHSTVTVPPAVPHTQKEHHHSTVHQHKDNYQVAKPSREHSGHNYEHNAKHTGDHTHSPKVSTHRTNQHHSETKHQANSAPHQRPQQQHNQRKHQHKSTEKPNGIRDKLSRRDHDNVDYQLSANAPEVIYVPSAISKRPSSQAGEKHASHVAPAPHGKHAVHRDDGYQYTKPSLSFNF